MAGRYLGDGCVRSTAESESFCQHSRRANRAGARARDVGSLPVYAAARLARVWVSVKEGSLQKVWEGIEK